MMTNRSAGAGRDGKLRELIDQWRDEATDADKARDSGDNIEWDAGKAIRRCADELDAILAVPDPLASSSETQGEQKHWQCSCGSPMSGQNGLCAQCITARKELMSNASSVPVRASGAQEWTALDGSLTIRFLQYINHKRAERWHGLNSWSALEWAGAMAGEAGEACNAAKKLKRIDDGIANINLEEGRSLTDVQNASAKIVDEIADTVIYGVLLASRVGMDLEEAIRMKFNRKSEEYGFPERIPPNQAPNSQAVRASGEPQDLWKLANDYWERDTDADARSFAETPVVWLMEFAKLVQASASPSDDGARQPQDAEVPMKYHVEPDAEGAGDWHVVTFSTGRRVQIFTQHPLVIVDPEVH